MRADPHYLGYFIAHFQQAHVAYLTLSSFDGHDAQHLFAPQGLSGGRFLPLARTVALSLSESLHRQPCFS